MFQKSNVGLPQLPPVHVPCPTCATQITLGVPRVNIALRDTIEDKYAEEVATRRAEDDFRTAQALEPRIECIRHNISRGAQRRQTLSTTGNMAAGYGGFVMLVVISSMFVAFLSGYSTARVSSPSTVPQPTNHLGLFKATGLSSTEELEKICSQQSSLKSTASCLGVDDPHKRMLLFRWIATTSAHPLVEWTTEDVETWVLAVLPSAAADAFLPAAKQLNGDSLFHLKAESDLTELGLASVHARTLKHELDHMNDGSPSLYEWALNNPDEYLLAEALILNPFTRILVRFNNTPELLQAATPWVECLQGQSVAAFWSSEIVYPYTCAIRAIESIPADVIGPEWTSRWNVRMLHFANLGFFITLPERIDKIDGEDTERTIRGTMATYGLVYRVAYIATTYNLSATYNLIRGLWYGVQTFFGLFVSYYVKIYCINYIFFFVPSAIGRFIMRNFLFYLVPILSCVFPMLTLGHIWTTGTWTTRLLFICTGLLSIIRSFKLAALDDDTESIITFFLAVGYVNLKALQKSKRLYDLQRPPPPPPLQIHANGA
jgi:hypothetical protein